MPALLLELEQQRLARLGDLRVERLHAEQVETVAQGHPGREGPERGERDQQGHNLGAQTCTAGTHHTVPAPVLIHVSLGRRTRNTGPAHASSVAEFPSSTADQRRRREVGQGRPAAPRPTSGRPPLPPGRSARGGRGPCRATVEGRLGSSYTVDSQRRCPGHGGVDRGRRSSASNTSSRTRSPPPCRAHRPQDPSARWVASTQPTARSSGRTGGWTAVRSRSASTAQQVA